MDKLLGGAAKLNTGYYLPLMGYGTYCLTGSKAVFAGLDAALKCGYRLIDTALLYQNEKDIGNSLKTLLPKYGLTREDVFITTKLDPRGRDEAKRIVQNSIKNLQTEYIDLVLVHFPMAWSGDPQDPINRKHREETYKVLEEFKDAGSIRSIGVSSYEPRHLDEISKYSKTVPAVNQCEFHPLFTRQNIQQKCKEMGVHFQAFTSLARNHAALVKNATVLDIAKRHNATAPQVALAYGLCQGVSVIPKSSSAERIASNYDAVNVKLTEEEIAALNALNKDRAFTPCCGWEIN